MSLRHLRAGITLAVDIIRATPGRWLFQMGALYPRSASDLAEWPGSRCSAMLPMRCCPFWDRGAAVSIEDGLVLARCIEEFDDVTEALLRYETTRRDRATFIQSKARSIVEHLQSAHPDRFGDTRFENEEALGLFNYDATTVAL